MISAKLLSYKNEALFRPRERNFAQNFACYNVDIQIKFNLVTYLGKKNHEKSFRQCFAINIDSDVMVIDLYSTVYNYFKKP